MLYDIKLSLTGKDKIYPVHVKKAYGGAEIYLHSFLNSPVNAEVKKSQST
jgi:hypothetical protein